MKRRIAALEGGSAALALASGAAAITYTIQALTIGYIVRNGSSVSSYGEAYVEELLKYKEL